MYSQDAYKAIVDSFEDVLAALDKLGVHILEELTAYPVWVDNGQGGFISNRRKVIQALQKLTFASGLEPNETYACPGVVGAKEKTFKLINLVNKTKDAFKLTAQAYLAKQPILANNTKQIRHVLRLSGYPRVSLKHTYRHLTYITYHPRRFGWTRAKSGSHVVISQAKARELLQKLGEGRHIDIQLAKLNQLKRGEKLVIFHEIKQGWLANVASFKDENGYSAMQKIRCALPIFYLHNEKLTSPEVYFSDKRNRNTNSHRADKKIQDAPFLSSINAYRYMM